MGKSKYRVYDLIINRQGASRDHGRIWFNAGMGINAEEDYYFYYITFDNYGDDSFDDEYQGYLAPQGHDLTYREFMHDLEFVSDEYGFRVDMEKLSVMIEQIRLKEMGLNSKSEKEINYLIDKYAEEYLVKEVSEELDGILIPMSELDTLFDDWGYSYLDACGFVLSGYSFSKGYRNKKPFNVGDDFLGSTHYFPTMGDCTPISVKKSQRVDFLKQELAVENESIEDFLNWCIENNKR